MGRLTKRCTFAVGAIVATCTCAVPWTPIVASDQNKSAPPPSYVETIYRPDCAPDEHCRLWHQCARCDADRQP